MEKKLSFTFTYDQWGVILSALIDHKIALKHDIDSGVYSSGVEQTLHQELEETITLHNVILWEGDEV